ASLLVSSRLFPSSCNPLLLVGALVLFAKYALSLDCFACIRCAVENLAAFVAEQNLQALTISTPANVLIDCFHRVAPQWFYACPPDAFDGRVNPLLCMTYQPLAA
ncbi:hypothetical protein, partial [Serratia marcescens]|uniref:hypothetical protein n=1 Tax=Serratia marcescens TaxID=615 RepID=UPI001F14EE49